MTEEAPKSPKIIVDEDWIDERRATGTEDALSAKSEDSRRGGEGDCRSESDCGTRHRRDGERTPFQNRAF